MVNQLSWQLEHVWEGLKELTRRLKILKSFAPIVIFVILFCKSKLAQRHLLTPQSQYASANIDGDLDH